jgi:hypothetical protein
MTASVIPLAMTTPGPVVQRLRSDLRLHVLFRHLHRCGPQPTAYCVAELLDAIRADPASLDEVLKWGRLSPDVVAALGGSNFPPPPMDVVTLSDVLIAVAGTP